MKTTEWNGLVRIVTGELTRPQNLRLQLDLRRLGEIPDLSDEEYLMRMDDMITVNAIRAVFVCDEGEWRELKRGESVAVAHQGEPLTLEAPITADALGQFPVSLSQPVVKAAAEENRYTLDLFLAPVSTPTEVTSTPASASAVAPSSAPAKAKRQKTKTTGA